MKQGQASPRCLVPAGACDARRCYVHCVSSQSSTGGLLHLDMSNPARDAARTPPSVSWRGMPSDPSPSRGRSRGSRGASTGGHVSWVAETVTGKRKNRDVAAGGGPCWPDQFVLALRHRAVFHLRAVVLPPGGGPGIVTSDIIHKRGRSFVRSVCLATGNIYGTCELTRSRHPTPRATGNSN